MNGASWHIDSPQHTLVVALEGSVALTRAVQLVTSVVVDGHDHQNDADRLRDHQGLRDHAHDSPRALHPPRAGCRRWGPLRQQAVRIARIAASELPRCACVQPAGWREEAMKERQAKILPGPGQSTDLNEVQERVATLLLDAVSCVAPARVSDTVRGWLARLDLSSLRPTSEAALMAEALATCPARSAPSWPSPRRSPSPRPATVGTWRRCGLCSPRT